MPNMLSLTGKGFVVYKCLSNFLRIDCCNYNVYKEGHKFLNSVQVSIQFYDSLSWICSRDSYIAKKKILTSNKILV